MKNILKLHLLVLVLGLGVSMAEAYGHPYIEYGSNVTDQMKDFTQEFLGSHCNQNNINSAERMFVYVNDGKDVDGSKTEYEITIIFNWYMEDGVIDIEIIQDNVSKNIIDHEMTYISSTVMCTEH